MYFLVRYSDNVDRKDDVNLLRAQVERPYVRRAAQLGKNRLRPDGLLNHRRTYDRARGLGAAAPSPGAHFWSMCYGHYTLTLLVLPLSVLV